MEWVWTGMIVAGVGGFLLAIDLLARLAPSGNARTDGDEEEEDEGSSFIVDEN